MEVKNIEILNNGNLNGNMYIYRLVTKFWHNLKNNIRFEPKIQLYELLLNFLDSVLTDWFTNRQGFSSNFGLQIKFEGDIDL